MEDVCSGRGSGLSDSERSAERLQWRQAGHRESASTPLCLTPRYKALPLHTHSDVDTQETAQRVCVCVFHHPRPFTNNTKLTACHSVTIWMILLSIFMRRCASQGSANAESETLKC